jgi:hypothetical protein
VQPRKHNRYRLGVPVVFFWRDAPETPHEGIGLTRDLSVSGAFVLTTSPPPLEADIKLKAFLPRGRSAIPPLRIHGQGQVVRVEPGHEGEPCGGFAVAGERFVVRRGEEYQ